MRIKIAHFVITRCASSRNNEGTEGKLQGKK